MAINQYDCDIHPGTKLHCPRCNGVKGGKSGGVTSIRKIQACRENARLSRQGRKKLVKD